MVLGFGEKFHHPWKVPVGLRGKGQKLQGIELLGEPMRFHEIKRMAKGMDINTYRMKKTDMIREIQRAENNIECYGTERIGNCQEEACLWRSDCLSLNSRMGEK